MVLSVEVPPEDCCQHGKEAGRGRGALWLLLTLLFEVVGLLEELAMLAPLV